MFDLSSQQWVWMALAAFLIGFSKTGIGGLGILVVPVMAAVFPAKESTGILLPMLIFADVFAILFYRRHADWGVLLRLFPFVIPGIVAGYLFMGRVSNEVLRPVIGIIVLVLLVVNLLLNRFRKEWIRPHWIFACVMGVLAGFTTMTANAAGPIMTIYLLAMNLDKLGFVGTRAWYFFCMNLFKVPFSAHLGLITFASLKFDLMVFPAIFAGAIPGYFFIKYIPQKWFEAAVLVLAAIAALNLVFS